VGLGTTDLRKLGGRVEAVYAEQWQLEMLSSAGEELTRSDDITARRDDVTATFWYQQ